MFFEGLKKMRKCFPFSGLEDHSLGREYGKGCSDFFKRLLTSVSPFSPDPVLSLESHRVGERVHFFFFFKLRAERIRIPEPWITPPDLQEKIHIFAQKCLFMTESLKQFTGNVQREL